jgi:chemotaxis protein methyltransferase CheR
MVALKPRRLAGARSRLTAEQFDTVRTLLHGISGIDLQEGKERLVQSRLGRSLRTLGLPDFETYLAYVQADRSGGALSDLVDALTTNETSFFRESRHLDVLCQEVLPPLRQQARPIRLWSAGCSTGEEPYTLAMVLRAALAQSGHSEVRILATDLSARALARARAATYDEARLKKVPDAYLRTAFRPLTGQPPRFRVADELRRMVRFARLNLMDAWPMRRSMDVIFCRNVMIYFDRPTRERLIARFIDMLAPGGHLFVGHSESLTASDYGLRFVQPAVYARCAGELRELEVMER